MNALDQINAEEFKVNNGKVLRMINILRHNYNKLKSIKQVIENDDVNEKEFLDSINFLSLEGYIDLRLIDTKKNINFADCDDYKKLEAKLTGKGIRLLAGGINDNMIEV